MSYSRSLSATVESLSNSFPPLSSSPPTFTLFFVLFLLFLRIFYVPSRPAVIFHAKISTLDHGACRRLVLLLFEIETKLRPRYALNPISDTLLPSHLRLSSVSSIVVRYKILPALIHYPNELLLSEGNEMKSSMLLRIPTSNKYFNDILSSLYYPKIILTSKIFKLVRKN